MTKKMNPRIKKMWVKALRSGAYKQGKGRLRNNNEFCCLGVLCNLHAQAHPKIAAKQTDPGLYMGAQAFTPDAVVKWAKLPHYNPRVRLANGDFISLSRLNDGNVPGIRRRTFEELADLIEEHL
jgi:hypothetical protein